MNKPTLCLCKSNFRFLFAKVEFLVLILSVLCGFRICVSVWIDSYCEGTYGNKNPSVNLVLQLGQCYSKGWGSGSKSHGKSWALWVLWGDGNMARVCEHVQCAHNCFFFAFPPVCSSEWLHSWSTSSGTDFFLSVSSFEQCLSANHKMCLLYHKC